MATKLPLEIQHNILTCLSSKDSTVLATTCTSWLPFLKTNIYTQVNIYSTKQCTQFIECLKESKKSVTTIQETNGYLVKEIILHTANILLSAEETRELQELTPMVTRFDYSSGVSLTDEHLYYFLPLWQHLTVLPVYHEDNSEDWIPALSQQLISLACHGNELDSIMKKKTNDENNRTIPNDYQLLVTTPSFPKLETLELNLQYTFQPLKLSTLEHIHQLCPLLTSFTLILEDTKIKKDIKNIKHQVMPYQALSKLKLDVALLLVGTGCFDYFMHKYQHLKSLEIIDHYSIDIDSDDDDDDDDDDDNDDEVDDNNCGNEGGRGGRVFKLITSNRELTSVRIVTKNENPVMPWDDLKQWIKKYRLISPSSDQLEHVSKWTIPIRLSEAEKNSNDEYEYFLQFP